MLDHLDQQHAVGLGQVLRVLRADLVEAHVGTQVLVEPVDRVEAVQLGWFPFIADPAQQVALAAADVQPAKPALRAGGLERALHDRVHR